MDAAAQQSGGQVPFAVGGEDVKGRVVQRTLPPVNCIFVPSSVSRSVTGSRSAPRSSSRIVNSPSSRTFSRSFGRSMSLLSSSSTSSTRGPRAGQQSRAGRFEQPCRRRQPGGEATHGKLPHTAPTAPPGAHGSPKQRASQSGGGRRRPIDRSGSAPVNFQKCRETDPSLIPDPVVSPWTPTSQPSAEHERQPGRGPYQVIGGSWGSSEASHRLGTLSTTRRR